MLASRIGKIPFPPETHGKPGQPYLTVEKIRKYPPIAAGETHPTVRNHAARKLSELNLKRMKNTPKNGGGRKDWPRNLWLKCHKKRDPGHTDVYGRMTWEKPSPTLTCKCNSVTNGRFGHPEQDRAISLREAAALQTFPDDFIFYGKNTNIGRHIGNAVPPLIGEVFGNALVKFVNSKSEKV
jgi:DNA (cytosine-5)-methyltransferase 1